MFNEADAQSPFLRAENFGFRLVKYKTPPAPALLRPIYYASRDFSKEKPVTDPVFKVIRGMYTYDKTPLGAVIDSVDDSNEHWRTQRISFVAAYGQERVVAYLFLPRRGTPPYQTVMYFPGSNGIQTRSSSHLQPPLEGAILKSGRAVVMPIYKGTFERGDALATDYPSRTDFYREHVLDWYNDLGRTLDYVESRRDLDASRIAYFGFSWGARLGPIFLAIDPRLKAAVLLSGGLKFARTFPEVDPFNFAPRVTAPVLMLNGKYDYFFPLETSQKPLLRLLGTPASNKRHVVFDSGHAPPSLPVVKELLDWLDRFLGPVEAT
jgi:dienelactone hydrolase